MNNESFHPLELVESVAGKFGPAARSLGVQINGYCEPQIPGHLEGRGADIHAVLEHLTRKAFDVTAQGGILIEVLKDVLKPRVRYCVSDSRTNVTADVLRAEIDTLLKEKIDHRTCGEILEELGTELEIEEKVLGRSTRIQFWLDMKRAEPNEPPLVVSERLLGLRVFLVSNDPPPNRIIQHYSRHAGIDLEGAPTASETFVELGKFAQTNPFHIVVVVTPIEDMSAAQVAQTIRKSELLQVKLLYVAPTPDPADRLTHIEAGYDDTIAKPFTKKDLFDAFERLAGRIPKASRARQTILIVEDNPINAKVAYFQLLMLGYAADVATNGEEAIAALETKNYVAVLMDLQMPVMNGLEATKRIRAAEAAGKRDRIPIIALTANEELKSQAMRAGCDGFLTKPANKDKLRDALESCIASNTRERFKRRA